jgi:hypothetical protein
VATIDAVRSAQSKLTKKLDSKIVVGVGIVGPAGSHYLKVNVRKEADRKKIPKQCNGVKIVTEVVGEIKAL